MYDNAQSVEQINGYTSNPVSIRSSVLQGCPLSMILYALCLNPLLSTLEQNLSGIRISQSVPSAKVVAYADDVTILSRHLLTFLSYKKRYGTMKMHQEHG
jgi:hypothetical protein